MPHVKSNVGNPKLTYHIQCETITEDEGEAEGEEARRGALVIEDGCDCDCCCCCCKACTTRVACSLRAARIWTRSANVTLDFRTGRGPGKTTTARVVVVVIVVLVAAVRLARSVWLVLCVLHASGHVRPMSRWIFVPDGVPAGVPARPLLLEKL